MKLYHCRVNMLFVRRDAGFTKDELYKLTLMTQAVVDAVGKASSSAIRCYVEVEPRIKLLDSTESDEGASMRSTQKADESSTDKPATERPRKSRANKVQP